VPFAVAGSRIRENSGARGTTSEFSQIPLRLKNIDGIVSSRPIPGFERKPTAVAKQPRAAVGLFLLVCSLGAKRHPCGGKEMA
jgi:hypothetical protein